MSAPTANRPSKEADFRITVFHDARLKPTTRLLGVAIAYRCWRTWTLYASLNKLAEWAGIGRSSVQRGLQELESLGYLVANGQKVAANGNATNVYLIRVPQDAPEAPENHALSPEEEAELIKQTSEPPAYTRPSFDDEPPF
ncbi:helix-turn-helix domain-containing protein [Saccharopolyspora shandongensis]|uniref:helix-turn-helix domain-containing protein n=1 Tax=Saccharopolyspora shandongensis TaxID=418495 RepID=UPI000B829368|nr:helix-turn-helix domain-containing protein [Saccharopolyspora shandongensis]